VIIGVEEPVIKYKKGGITFYPDYSPDKYERRTAMLIAQTGKMVEFMVSNRQKGAKTADVVIDDLIWEIKNPKGKGKYTLERCISVASKQSENLILDLRRMEGPYRKYLGLIKREFDNNQYLKRLKIINKAQKIIDFVK